MAAGFGTTECFSCGRQHIRVDVVTDIHRNMEFKRGHFCPPDKEKMDRFADASYVDSLRRKQPDCVYS